MGSGVYLLRLAAGQFRQTQKVVLGRRSAGDGSSREGSRPHQVLRSTRINRIRCTTIVPKSVSKTTGTNAAPRSAQRRIAI